MGGVELTPGVRYDMPAAFGPSVAPDVEEGFDIRGSEIFFETSPEAVEALLPRWFRPAERPVVSVCYRHMIRMGWMGGRDYRLVTFRVTTHCDAVEGSPVNPYSWVIWESDCAPVLAGRELMGSPKLFADIPVARAGGEDHEFTCHEYEALLVRGRLHGLREVSRPELDAALERMREARSYYWKYIPGPGGTVDADYPVAIRMDIPYVQMWKGAGELELNVPTAVEAPYSSKIMAALAALPRLSQLTASSWHAVDCKLFRGETRRLDLPA
ncbi:acetoacetate decarboxylase family protein [Nonomuraea harbinensis]|uniref:Acetoacetate decarboxylase family protein n=1 Tax=Nonomuraea harbinensis TaxID=1286938 RepID=A0ABW1BY82_9ACTN|nr:acetoacetate decarboxylase family protein [Nonomuraea harbinensis]